MSEYIIMKYKRSVQHFLPDMRNIALLLMKPTFLCFVSDESGFLIFENAFTERGFLSESWDKVNAFFKSYGKIEGGKLIDERSERQKGGENFLFRVDAIFLSFFA